MPILFLHGIGGAAWSWEPQAVALARGVYLSGSSTFLPLSGIPGFGALWLAFLLALAEGFRYDALPANLYARAIFARAFHDRAAMKRAWTHQRRQRPVEYRQAMLELTGASTRFPRRQFAREITCPVRLIEAAGLGSALHVSNLVAQLRPLGPKLRAAR